MQKYLRCYATVSLNAIAENIKKIKNLLPQGTKLMAVIKADAYGHGASVVGNYIEKMIDCAGVASLEEGIELRESGFDLPILVLGYSSPKQFEQMLKYEVMPTIYRYETAVEYSKEAVRCKLNGECHIAIDTGMTRIGFRATEESAETIKKISELPNISIQGMFTHLSCADTYDEEYNQKQFDEFDHITELLKEKNVDIPVKHICNSAGIMKYKDRYFDCVRSGIITYGMYPSEEVDKSIIDLTPALEWKTHVINISEVEEGRGVSYGATYVTQKPVTKIATIAVGYADGYPRSLSSKGEVLIRGKRAPIVGRVCMDQMMVDVTHIPDVEIEDTVTLIGKDKDEYISIEELADKAGSFNYEMACGIGKRVKRVYIK
jgi:alanine racemase